MLTGAVNVWAETVSPVVEETKMRNSAKTALGGMIAALSIITMLLTAVIPYLTYALPAVSGVLLVLMVIEINKKWAVCTFVAVSILSFLILPDKEAAMMYAAFFGCYPIVKPVLESKIQNNALCWTAKAVFFNTTAVSAYLIIIYVFGIPLEEMEEMSKWAIPALLGMGNIMFVLYDICITRMVTLYIRKWQKKFRKLFRH